MRTRFAVLAALLVPLGVVRADDATAEADWKELSGWMESSAPKKAEQKKPFQAESEKRLRAFLEKHPTEAKFADPARYVLARLLADQRKFDDAVKLYDELIKSEDEEMRLRGRFGSVRALAEKRDLRAARARLDGYLKLLPDHEDLLKLDAYLKELEGHAKKGATLKKGAAAPPIAGVELSGKVWVVEFARSDAPPCKKGWPRLAELAKKWKVDVVTIALEPDDKAKAANLSWKVISGDAAKDVAREWGIATIPWVAVVGKDGKLVGVGLRADEGKDLADTVELAVTGKKPKLTEKELGLDGE
jgi:thiol-disulfide isomerase/thioredoxin